MTKLLATLIASLFVVGAAFADAPKKDETPAKASASASASTPAAEAKKDVKTPAKKDDGAAKASASASAASTK